MKKLLCALLAAAMLSGGTALAHEDEAQLDPVLQILSEYEDADAQLDALLELRARLNDMIEQLGSEEYAPLERNDINEQVTRLQERLFELGFLSERRINGKYDNDTVKAVKQFEKANGLDNDGEASALDQIILFSDSALNKGGERAGAAAPNNPAPSEDGTSDNPAPSEDGAPDEDEVEPEADLSNLEAEPEANDIEPEADASGEPAPDGYAPFDYAEYSADPDAYEDSAVLLEGSVMQLLSAQDGVGALVLLTGDMQRIYVEADEQALDGISGGDELRICAHISGSYQYTTLLGQARALPRAVADSVEALS